MTNTITILKPTLFPIISIKITDIIFKPIKKTKVIITEINLLDILIL